MINLPIEVVQHIFSYLPILTDELMGKGDGGMKKWKELKESAFYFGCDFKEVFDQFKDKKFSKIIQFCQPSVAALFDCFFSPPFFPEMLTLKILALSFSDLKEFPEVFKYFRLHIVTELIEGSLEVFNKYPIQWDEIKVDSTDILSEFIGFDVNKLSVKNVFDPSVRNQFPVKELTIPFCEWGWDVEGVLRDNLTSVCIEFSFHPYELGERFIFDFPVPHLKKVCVRFPPQFPCLVELDFPEGVEELETELIPKMFHTNLPKSLRNVRLENYNKLDISQLPSTIENLQFSPISGSFSHFTCLRELELRGTKEIFIYDLPPSLEIFTVSLPIQLAVDFRTLANLRCVTFLDANFPKLFSHYETIEISRKNSLTFKEGPIAYCVPFHENLRSMTIESMETNQFGLDQLEWHHFGSDRWDPFDIICYPASLRCLEFLYSSRISLLKNFPKNLKALRCEGTYSTSSIKLPPNLEILDIDYTSMDMVEYDSLKHAYLSGCDIKNMKFPENLRTFKCLADKISDFPEVLDLSTTKITDFTFGLCGEQNREDLEENPPLNLPTPLHRVIYPSTTRNLEIRIKDESVLSIDDSSVDWDIYRSYRI